MLVDESSIGFDAYQTLTEAMGSFRRYYETHIWSVLARADCAVISLHAFLNSNRVKRFYVDPDAVAAVERALAACCEGIEAVERELAYIDTHLEWSEHAQARIQHAVFQVQTLHPKHRTLNHKP